MKRVNSMMQWLLFVLTPFVFLYFSGAWEGLSSIWVLKVFATKAVASLVALTIALLGVIPVKKIAYGSVSGRKRLITLSEKHRITRNYLMIFIPVLCIVEYGIFAQILNLRASWKGVGIFIAVGLPSALLALQSLMEKIRQFEKETVPNSWSAQGVSVMKAPLPNLMIQGRETFQAYRNIATCSPSQNLFDDLVEEDDWSVLQYADSLSSGIDHQRTLFRWNLHSGFFKPPDHSGSINPNVFSFSSAWKWTILLCKTSLNEFRSGDFHLECTDEFLYSSKLSGTLSSKR